jgi:hypothetical protein
MIRNIIKRQLLISAILLLAVADSFAQIPGDFPHIDKKDLSGAKFSSPKIYSGTSLFGYIDGGAELYLEYGFLMASVTEISYMNGIFKIEIYKMNGAEEAFGIFSVSKYRCRSVPGLPGISCQTKYQLQICRSQYYISIINRTGTKNDSIASVLIGKLITDKIVGNDVDLKSYFPDIEDNLLKSGCSLVKGRIGIVNGSPDLEDFFSECDGYTAVIYKNGKTNISVKFNNAGSYKKFIEVHKLKEDKSDTGPSFIQIADCHLLIELPD